MYRTDMINGAMGAQRLTNERLAELAGVAIGTVSAIRNGNPNVTLPTISAVAEALGLTLAELFTPKPQRRREPAGA